MTLERLFAGALKVIRDPKNWTKGAFARSTCRRNGRSTPLFDARTQAYCLAGALMKAAGPDKQALAKGHSFGHKHKKLVQQAEWRLTNLIMKATGRNVGVTLWNDQRGRKHSEVINLLKQARGSAKR